MISIKSQLLLILPISIISLKKILNWISSSSSSSSSSSLKSIKNEEDNSLKQALDRFIKTNKLKLIEKLSMTLSRFSHQVAGHTDEDLLCIDGKVMKPSRKTTKKIQLFLREIAIYELMYSIGNYCVQSARNFTSKYHGVVILANTNKLLIDSNNNNSNNSQVNIYNNNITSSDINSVPYLVLDDLTLSYRQPCVIDIKMGTQTYEPNASLDKATRENEKYRYQSELGFRIAGFKVYDILSGTEKSIGKVFGRSLLPHQVTGGLSLFFYNGLHYRKDVVLDVIQKLEKLLLWMRSQTSVLFYCSSILIVYDGAPSAVMSSNKSQQSEQTLYHFLDVKKKDSTNSNQTKIREGEKANILKVLYEPQSSTDISRVHMIDFAHTIHSTMLQNYPLLSSRKQVGLDYGYIHGLEVLLSKLYEIKEMNEKTNEEIIEKLIDQ